MKADQTSAFAAVLSLLALAGNSFALKPPKNLPEAVVSGSKLVPREAPRYSPGGVRTISDACPATNVDVLASGSTIVGSTIGSSDDFVAGCGSQPGGRDEIFEFRVDLCGIWTFDSCTVPACWDTTLEIREETGGGCPGDFVACDGDGCSVCFDESAVSTVLNTGATYYLIVDGWTSFSFGDFTISASLTAPGCTSDADCDDGLFCNGVETCEVAACQCLSGSNPCTTYEGYSLRCDDNLDQCVKADDCFTWIAGAASGNFFPEADHCPDLASWVLDDVQGSHHTTGVLDFYTTPIVARSTPAGASPLGTVFLVNQALFTVEAGTCNPLAEIAGSQCTGAATVDLGGSPAHDLPCSGMMPLLPNNSGNFNVCEIDFFLAYRMTENGAGMEIARQKPLLGGPAGADDFGESVIWIEDCPPTGVYTPTSFGDDVNLPADFANAVVCQKPGGVCCAPDGSCSLVSEADCAAIGGIYGGTGTTNDDPGTCDDAICLPADPHITLLGTSATFGAADVPPIPADFFFLGSLSFVGPVNLVGGATDTLGQRSEPIDCPSFMCVDDFGSPLEQPVDCDPANGDADCTVIDPIFTCEHTVACNPVAVELVQLDLGSAAPIVVGGPGPPLWDVAVDLSPTGSPPSGTINATRTHANGGTYDADIPFSPRFTFTEVGNPANVRVLDYDVEGIMPILINFVGADFVVNLGPGLFGTILAPNDGNFVPGVRENTPGNPNSQIVIGAIGLSKGGGIDHPVQPPPPLPADPHMTLFGTAAYFGLPDLTAIPADFFFPGSPPFFDQIILEGGLTNTLVQRSASIACPGAGFPRPCHPVSAQLAKLDLVSASPIMVDTTEWDVVVDLSPGGSQPLGTINATLTHANGGKYNADIPVSPRFTFTEVGNPANVRVLDFGRRCVGGDNAGEPCTVDNPDCARLGVCSIGGTPCVVANNGLECGLCSISGEGCDADGFFPCPPPDEICEFNVAQTCVPLNRGICGEGLSAIIINFLTADWVGALGPGLVSTILAPNDGNFVPGVRESVPGDPTSQELIKSLGLSKDGGIDHVVLPAELLPPLPDPHDTLPGTSAIFGAPDVPAIPADFFYVDSDPFSGPINLIGGATDTLGQRSGLIVCPGAGFPRPCDPVSVELIQLDLVSASPITVQPDGSQWDVRVALSPTGSPPLGSMTVTLTHPNGGTYDADIPFVPVFIFTEVGNPANQRSLDYDSLGRLIRINFLAVDWVIELGSDLVGRIVAPNDGNFVPGVRELFPGDPNSQDVIQALGESKGGGIGHPVQPPLTGGCPADDVGVLTDGSTIVGSTVGSTDDFLAGCASQPGGQDEIFEFSVDLCGTWTFDSCTVPAGWDTTLEIREETGGGCPGDLVACDGDGCDAGAFESAVSALLDMGPTYYLIVDGWSTFAFGDFTITASLAEPCGGGGPEIRFLPNRTAPLGSPSGTVGAQVTPKFNGELGCWEVFVSPGVEVDLDLQARGWGNAVGSPTLGSIQATVVPGGYNNGVGSPLNPKGWPTSPQDGAYQAKNWCDPQFGGNGAPCNTGPFGLCAAGFCLHNPDWIMPVCANDLPAMSTATLNYFWATAAQVEYVIDDFMVKTMGGLILEVPCDAEGTYLIDLDPDPNNSFMANGQGAPIPGVVFTPACISICDTDADCDDAICIPADPLDTLSGTSATFGEPDVPAIPAGFFFPGSPQFDGTVELQRGPTHTLVQRSGPIECPGGGFPRPCDPVAVELAQLDLVSADPITVGGRLWDVAVDLSPTGSPPLGTINATLTHANGGTYDADIPFSPRFTFTEEEDPGNVRILDYDPEGIMPIRINFVGADWVVVLGPDLVGTIVAPNDGNFVPGVLELIPGDPNSQMVTEAVGLSEGGGIDHPVQQPLTRPPVIPPILAGSPHDILKNRYISIDPRGASQENSPGLKVRVTMTSSLVNGVTGIGTDYFAGAPDADCVSVVTSVDPGVIDWSGCPAVHLTGCPIIPTSTYDIVVIDDQETVSATALSADTQAKPGVKWHSDCVGMFNGVGWTPPNGVTNIDDTVACIKTFQDPDGFNATHLSVTDLEPNLNGTQINKVVNIADCFTTILGFQGNQYPGPDVAQCP